jgi:hypothetical protein
MSAQESLTAMGFPPELIPLALRRANGDLGAAAEILLDPALVNSMRTELTAHVPQQPPPTSTQPPPTSTQPPPTSTSHAINTHEVTYAGLGDLSASVAMTILQMIAILPRQQQVERFCEMFPAFDAADVRSVLARARGVRDAMDMFYLMAREMEALDLQQEEEAKDVKERELEELFSYYWSDEGRRKEIIFLLEEFPVSSEKLASIYCIDGDIGRTYAVLRSEFPGNADSMHQTYSSLQNSLQYSARIAQYNAHQLRKHLDSARQSHLHIDYAARRVLHQIDTIGLPADVPLRKIIFLLKVTHLDPLVRSCVHWLNDLFRCTDIESLPPVPEVIVENCNRYVDDEAARICREMEELCNSTLAPAQPTNSLFGATTIEFNAAVPTPVVPTPVPAAVPTPVVATPAPAAAPTPVVATPAPAAAPTPVVATPAPAAAPTPVVATPAPAAAPTPVVATPAPAAAPTPVVATPAPAAAPTPVVATPAPAAAPTPVVATPTAVTTATPTAATASTATQSAAPKGRVGSLLARFQNNTPAPTANAAPNATRIPGRIAIPSFANNTPAPAANAAPNAAPNATRIPGRIAIPSFANNTPAPTANAAPNAAPNATRIPGRIAIPSFANNTPAPTANAAPNAAPNATRIPGRIAIPSFANNTATAVAEPKPAPGRLQIPNMPVIGFAPSPVAQPPVEPADDIRQLAASITLDVEDSTLSGTDAFKKYSGHQLLKNPERPIRRARRPTRRPIEPMKESIFGNLPAEPVDDPTTTTAAEATTTAAVTTPTSTTTVEATTTTTDEPVTPSSPPAPIPGCGPGITFDPAAALLRLRRINKQWLP